MPAGRRTYGGTRKLPGTFQIEFISRATGQSWTAGVGYAIWQYQVSGSDLFLPRIEWRFIMADSVAPVGFNVAVISRKTTESDPGMATAADLVRLRERGQLYFYQYVMQEHLTPKTMVIRRRNLRIRNGDSLRVLISPTASTTNGWWEGLVRYNEVVG